MKTMTIQQPERYEAPKVKIKELRKRSVICASNGDGNNPSLGEEEDSWS